MVEFILNIFAITNWDFYIEFDIRTCMFIFEKYERGQKQYEWWRLGLPQ